MPVFQESFADRKCEEIVRLKRQIDTAAFNEIPILFAKILNAVCDVYLLCQGYRANLDGQLCSEDGMPLGSPLQFLIREELLTAESRNALRRMRNEVAHLQTAGPEKIKDTVLAAAPVLDEINQTVRQFLGSSQAERALKEMENILPTLTCRLDEIARVEGVMNDGVAKFRHISEMGEGLTYRQKKIFETLIDNVEANMAYQELDSLAPGEGKTFVLLKLVKYFLSLKKRVLYYNPRVQSRTRFENEFASDGLFKTVDLLSGKMRRDEAFDLIILEDIDAEMKASVFDPQFSATEEHSRRVITDALRAVVKHCPVIVVRDDRQSIKTVTDIIKTSPFSKSGVSQCQNKAPGATTYKPKRAHKHVFISYSTVEKEIAYKTKSILESNGISCWMAPESIPPGSSYILEIPVAIENSLAMVVLLSEASQKSQWVSREVENALGLSIPIIPFHLDGSFLNKEFNFMLSQKQRIKAFERMSEAHEELVAILKALQQVR